MILLWGIPSDGPLAAVERILRQEGVPYAFVDQRAILDTELRLEVGVQVRGTLAIAGDRLHLEDVDAVYIRSYEPEQFQILTDAGPESEEYRHATAFHTAMSIWLDLTPAMVINRPRDMALNYSKPYQAAIIERTGFAIPETLLTTDPVEARIFRQKHGSTIYKSVSALRSIVSQLRPEDEARLGAVTSCPTQFQRRIAGPEVRVHVVGTEVFASEVISGADDYRYAPLSGDSLEIRPFDLDAECADRCRAVAAAMDFHVAGIDLRLEDGVWYCFEVNPAPSFTYYQEQTGHKIEEAVVRLLTSRRAQAA